MRRPLRHVGRPASLLQGSKAPRTGRRLDLTFAAGVRAFATGRSRRVLGRQGALLALRRGRVATRGVCIRSRSGLRAAMRVLEPVGTAGRHLKLTLPVPVARGLRINRHSAQVGLDGRGQCSLVGVLGFHLDLADSRRSAARERTVRRPKALRTRGARSPFTRAPRETDLGLGNGWPPQGATATWAPGSSEAARASTKPEEDAGSMTRAGGRSGQRAVKRAAHARRVNRQADRRDEIRVLFDKLGSLVLVRRTSH